MIPSNSPPTGRRNNSRLDCQINGGIEVITNGIKRSQKPFRMAIRWRLNTNNTFSPGRCPSKSSFAGFVSWFAMCSHIIQQLSVFSDVGLTPILSYLLLSSRFTLRLTADGPEFGSILKKSSENLPFINNSLLAASLRSLLETFKRRYSPRLLL